MLKSIFFIIISLHSVPFLCSAQKNPNFASNRNVIIHLFEWRWLDIAAECERYLKDTKYGGVQVSPPTENLIIGGRPWSERYHPISYNLTTRSGTESEFLEMVQRCNKVGIRIYADVIFNHMASMPGTGTAGNKALSDLKTYPALGYTPEHFHPTCNITNYLNPQVVRECELKNFRDLDQSDQYVRDNILELLNNLIKSGVAGFRIDSAKYMWPDDLAYIYSKLNALSADFPAKSTAFIYQDVPLFEKDLIGNKEYASLGTVLEYGYSGNLSRIFSGKDNLTNLMNWGTDWGFLPSQDSVVFVDSFVNQRNDGVLNYKSIRQYKMAIIFMLAHPFGNPAILSSYFFSTKDGGPPQDSAEQIKSPIIYSDGSCGNGYVCEHRWPQIANMVEFRSIVSDSGVENWWSDNYQQIAFSRSNKGFVALTNGKDLVQTLQTGLPAGTYCDIISGRLLAGGKCSGKSVKVDAKGLANISILETDYDGAVAIHANSKV